MDDRVEGRDAAPCRLVDIQGQHIPLPKFDARGQLPRQLDHARREVDAQNPRAALVQVVRDLPRPAAHVADRPARVGVGGQPVQQLAVQRLMLELVKDSRDVLLSDLVVALAQLIEVHSLFSSQQSAIGSAFTSAYL